MDCVLALTFGLNLRPRKVKAYIYNYLYLLLLQIHQHQQQQQQQYRLRHGWRHWVTRHDVIDQLLQPQLDTAEQRNHATVVPLESREPDPERHHHAARCVRQQSRHLRHSVQQQHAHRHQPASAEPGRRRSVLRRNCSAVHRLPDGHVQLAVRSRRLQADALSGQRDSLRHRLYACSSVDHPLHDHRSQRPHGAYSHPRQRSGSSGCHLGPDAERQRADTAVVRRRRGRVQPLLAGHIEAHLRHVLCVRLRHSSGRHRHHFGSDSAPHHRAAGIQHGSPAGERCTLLLTIATHCWSQLHSVELSWTLHNCAVVPTFKLSLGC